MDEPALREGLPLKSTRHAEYLQWAVNAFRLATACASPGVQVSLGRGLHGSAGPPPLGSQCCNAAMLKASPPAWNLKGGNAAVLMAGPPAWNTCNNLTARPFALATCADCDPPVLLGL